MSKRSPRPVRALSTFGRGCIGTQRDDQSGSNAVMCRCATDCARVAGCNEPTPGSASLKALRRCATCGEAGRRVPAAGARPSGSGSRPRSRRADPYPRQRFASTVIRVCAAPVALRSAAVSPACAYQHSTTFRTQQEQERHFQWSLRALNANLARPFEAVYDDRATYVLAGAGRETAARLLLPPP
jgi:hypothetical protein